MPGLAVNGDTEGPEHALGVVSCRLVLAHARAAAAAGATPEEVAEMLGVAVLMGGGPATVYAPRAWAAFAEFAPEQVKTA